jgi:pimeloyl-ACP methyl ester carboxylesterase/DNA-binding CsgD family transcriptional regulator
VQQQTRFLKTDDGVRLAYRTMGKGPALVVVPSLLSHLELDEREVVPPSFFERLGSGRQLVRYDKRGMGLSTRHLSDYSLEAQVGDLRALIGHLELKDVTLFGSSQGAAIAIAYAAQYPKAVRRLIVFGAYHRFSEQSRQTTEAMLPLVGTAWKGVGTAPLCDVYVPGSSPEVRSLFARYQREAANADDAVEILRAAVNLDITDYLPEIKAPTLVIHRKGDQVVGVRRGRELASLIAGARFALLEGQVHLPYWGDTEPVLRAIEAFLDEDDETLPAGLSEREAEVLRLLAAGRSNREIAEALSISVNTADRHVSNIFTKIGASNRAEAASFAVRNRLA